MNTNAFTLIDFKELEELMKKDKSKLPEIQIPEQSEVYQKISELSIELFKLKQDYDSLKQEYDQYRQEHP